MSLYFDCNDDMSQILNEFLFHHTDKSKYVALEFTDVCEHYLGKLGKLSGSIFSLGALFGVTTVYIVLLSNFMYNIGEFIHCKYRIDTHHICNIYREFISVYRYI